MAPHQEPEPYVPEPPPPPPSARQDMLDYFRRGARSVLLSTSATENIERRIRGDKGESAYNISLRMALRTKGEKADNNDELS